MIQSIPTNSGVAPGGAVGGASSLTTVGAIPYVTSAGVLGQDATALFWDATNDRLGVGTASPAATAHLRGSLTTLLIENTAVNNTTIQLKTSGGLNHYIYSDQAGGNSLNIATGSGTALVFSPFATERARFAATTGNLLIGGGTTDGNYRLDVNTSGSTGTLRVYDQGGAGSTLAVIQAGAAQSGDIQQWKNNGGANVATMDKDGNFGAVAHINALGTIGFGGTYFGLGSANVFRFSSTIAFTGTPDVGLYRNAAGVLEINSGTAGTLRDLYLRRERFEAVAVTNLPAAASWPGTVQYVTDALGPVVGVAVAGGGAVPVLVWSNGTSWKVMAV